MASQPNRFKTEVFPVICLMLTAMMACLSSQALAMEAQNTAQLEGLDWRLIGPYRGGRVTTVTGVADKPMLYFMGATGGGVWKTENAGTTWENLTDEYFRVGTIGAVAVAESDHNVLYVGTGESPIRGVTTSHGDGVWKSTDGGKTWKHIGLKESGQISRIRIHPQNPDIACVAVQGQIWGPNEERGVFRTPGRRRKLGARVESRPPNRSLGPVTRPDQPRILYAAMWNHGRKPWFVHSGGTDGGIYKSTDSGDSWNKLGGGLPELIGKIGVDVSASNPKGSTPSSRPSLGRAVCIAATTPARPGPWFTAIGYCTRGPGITTTSRPTRWTKTRYTF